MVYRRRSYKRKPRRTYKRRTFRRRTIRRATNKSTRYDGVVYSKCVASGDFQIDGANPYAYLLVSWGSTGITTTKAVYVDGIAEFNTMANLYEQYKIQGFKIKIEYISQVTGAAGSGLYAAHRASDPN